MFSQQTLLLTPPVGSTQVVVVLTADPLHICAPRSPGGTGRLPTVLMSVALRAILGASRCEGPGSQERIKFLSAAGAYSFAGGSDDLAPAVRA